MNKESIITASDQDLAQMLHEIRCCKNNNTGEYVILHIEEASEIITEACKRLALKNRTPMRSAIASAAMQGLLSSHKTVMAAIKRAIINEKNGKADANWASCIACDAVEAADALIAQLEKTKRGETPLPV